ncbi:carboxypeptidase regulatory-like domain-containing protein [Limisphaera ngatamarikiensis]|uniref:Carboxypeptidase regulatory-like domain-containing protein n=1 Tax=Limisphaera ngatamarikiensis TaxID=1324935 RepID=A0A6M1RVH4_9BACT|nr:carboxypeptidase-like regulatory domain-containing protein [Limisphaera ngatamarikiensis]NGO39354.1 carboxypeptidase regulatory-like domain-containing protein [Limisphaera ngatamarikiensis]
MKMQGRSSTSRRGGCVFGFFPALVGFLLLPGLDRAWGAVTFDVSPASASTSFSGMVELTVQGLQESTVIIRRGLDLNGNGALDPGEPVTLHIEVTDNEVPILAGVTNWNIPFDQDPAVGALRVRINYYQTWLGHTAGTHVWQLVSPTGRFSPIQAIQRLTPPALGQGVRGVVRGGSTNQPAAMVVALDLMADASLAALVVADSQGRYELPLPPGVYAVIPVKPGWVTDMDAAFFAELDAGRWVSADLELLSASRTLSGRLVRADRGDVGLPAVFLQVESDAGLLAVAWTDADGSFVVPVRTGTWTVRPALEDLALRGCLFASRGQSYGTSTGSVSGIRVEVDPANAAFYGRVVDAEGRPMAGIRLRVSGQTGGLDYDGDDPVTDDQGRYTGMVVGGESSWWQVLVDPMLNRSLSNHVISGFRFAEPMAPGEARAQDLRVVVATNEIVGTVRNANGLPVREISVLGRCRLGGEVFYGSGWMTDPEGRYRMPVIGGSWEVHLLCYDLQDAGYNCAPMQTVTVAGRNTGVDFVVFPQPAPVLSQPVWSGPQQFRFQIHGLPWTTYEVQVSGDLRQWQTLTTVTPVMEGGPFYTGATVTDSSAGSSPRFYRLLRR